MKVRRIVASQILLFAALMASAEVQTANAPVNQGTVQSTTQPSRSEMKAEKSKAKQARRQAKYDRKAAKDRVNATKQQEKAAKTRAKANSRSDKADIDRAKAAKDQQQAVPQP
ncbi:MAG: hypothetical protein M3Y72_03440 [Acidobacteriota bacterium]|nr:hypothetical protein [Acidobacteriota bacterium]